MKVKKFKNEQFQESWLSRLPRIDYFKNLETQDWNIDQESWKFQDSRSVKFIIHFPCEIKLLNLHRIWPRACIFCVFHHKLWLLRSKNAKPRFKILEFCKFQESWGPRNSRMGNFKNLDFQELNIDQESWKFQESRTSRFIP